MNKVKSLYIPPEQVISNMIKRGRVAHSFLLTGQRGTGKTKLALELAKLLLCKNPIQIGSNQFGDRLTFCNHCSSCRKVNNLIHPDLYIVEPQNDVIKIDQVREIKHFFSLKPLEGGNRICIISHAETMRLEASNALLKILEEPPKGAYIFLTAPNPNFLLPTIVSRCLILRCKGEELSKAFNLLVKKFPNSPKELCYIAIYLAEGDIERAQTFLSDDFISWRKRLFSFLSQDWGQAKNNITKELFWLAEYMGNNPTIFINCIELLRSWIRDIFIVLSKRNSKDLLNLDLLKFIYAATCLYDIKKLQNIIVELDSVQNLILRNINLILYSESLLIRLKQKNT